MALEGTVKTPFGVMQKKTAAIAGVGLTGVLGIAWYRSKKAKADAAAASTTSAGALSDPNAIDPATGLPYSQEGVGYDQTSNIDPATGYPYGSSEDQSAYMSQAGYSGYSGYGGNYPTNPSANPVGPGSFTNNQMWAQYVEDYMTNTVGGNAAEIGNAVGKYLTGQAVTSTQKSLIEQAIAFGGYPPVNGVSGFPPSIKTAPPAGPPPHTHPTIIVHANGHMRLHQIATAHHNSLAEAEKLNPWAQRFWKSGKVIPKGYKVKLYKR